MIDRMLIYGPMQYNSAYVESVAMIVHKKCSNHGVFERGSEAANARAGRHAEPSTGDVATVMLVVHRAHYKSLSA